MTANQDGSTDDRPAYGRPSFIYPGNQSAHNGSPSLQRTSTPPIGGPLRNDNDRQAPPTYQPKREQNLQGHWKKDFGSHRREQVLGASDPASTEQEMNYEEVRRGEAQRNDMRLGDEPRAVHWKPSPGWMDAGDEQPNVLSALEMHLGIDPVSAAAVQQRVLLVKAEELVRVSLQTLDGNDQV